MKTCIICNKKTYFYKQIGKSEIYECFRCKLAHTHNTLKTHSLYSPKGVYALNDYLNYKINHTQKFTRIADTINKTVKKGPVLEVGAGFGLLSHILSQNKNYHIEVVEPNLPLHFIQNTNKIQIHKKTYQDFLFQNKKRYDTVILLDVLEHFENPDKILRQTKTILNENGNIVLQFPNYKSFIARICRNWSWWMVEDHKYHFSPSSITLLLKKEGFKIVHMGTYESLHDFKKNLDGNFISIKNAMVRKIMKSVYFALFFSIYLLMRKLMWKFGFGGLIFIIAKQNN